VPVHALDYHRSAVLVLISLCICAYRVIAVTGSSRIIMLHVQPARRINTAPCIMRSEMLIMPSLADAF
jgi:hypothetical protein